MDPPCSVLQQLHRVKRARDALRAGASPSDPIALISDEDDDIAGCDAASGDAVFAAATPTRRVLGQGRKRLRRHQLGRGTDDSVAVSPPGVAHGGSRQLAVDEKPTAAIQQQPSTPVAMSSVVASATEVASTVVASCTAVNTSTAVNTYNGSDVVVSASATTGVTVSASGASSLSVVEQSFATMPVAMVVEHQDGVVDEKADNRGVPRHQDDVDEVADTDDDDDDADGDDDDVTQERMPQYYLDNMRLVLTSVLGSQAHLLPIQTVELLQRFCNASEDAQRLFLRLRSRKGPWFRLDRRVRYREISNIASAARELVQAKLFLDAVTVPWSDSAHIAALLSSLFHVPELRRIFTAVCHRSGSKLDRAALVHKLASRPVLRQRTLFGQSLLQHSVQRLLGRVHCVAVAGDAATAMRVLNRLFFLDAAQDQTTLLLHNMALARYPSYTVTPTSVFEDAAAFHAWNRVIDIEVDVDAAAMRRDFPFLLMTYPSLREQLNRAIINDTSGIMTLASDAVPVCTPVTAASCFDPQPVLRDAVGAGDAGSGSHDDVDGAAATAAAAEDDVGSLGADDVVYDEAGLLKLNAAVQRVAAAAAQMSWRQRFTARWALVRAVHHVVPALERFRCYTEACAALSLLLSLPLSRARRGAWWDRLSINYVHMHRYHLAHCACWAGLHDPCVRFKSKYALQRRYLRLSKRLGLPVTPQMQPLLQLPRVPVVREIRGTRVSPSITSGSASVFIGADGEPVSVEQYALHWFNINEQWNGVHCESRVLTTLWALLFWDIIFAADVPDVFPTQYRTCPLDITTPSFYHARADAIEQRLAAIAEPGAAATRLAQCWEDKHAQMCIGVSWDIVSLDELLLILQGIPPHSLAQVCRHFATDYTAWTGGLPDLVLWKQGAATQFVEIKGPGDRLADNQVIWLDQLVGLGLDACVCYVRDA